jgi:RNA polymerase sigma-70 factor (ECF subfamily)
VTVGEDAVATLYRRYFPLLLRKCRRMLGETAAAQDTAQETFTRLWQQRDSVKDPEAVVAWLYTTSTRLAVDRMRSPRTAVAEAPDLPDPRAAPDRLAEARAVLARVRTTLQRDQLELLVLSRIDGLSQREIADLQGSSERTVRRRLAELDLDLQRLGADHG